MFESIQTELPGVIILEPRVFGDDRGFFFESYRADEFAELGIRDSFVQDNHSCSRRGTLRGLHYQPRRPQAKLCRVIHGEVLDVIVDIRRGSPTFGRWTSAVLSAENKRELYVPRGFAHGFSVLSEEAEILYKCSDFYDPEEERGLHWSDPQLAIGWRVSDPIVSVKDGHNPRLAEVLVADLPVYTGPS